MKLFLDSADVGEIHNHFSTGLIDGVTTNPTLIRKSGRKPQDVYRELMLMGVPDVSMEIVGNAPYIVSEAHKLVEEFGDMCTIKVPMTREGLQACRELTKENIRTNVTLIFCAAQAVLAAKAGATYVSPFVGRLDDQSVAGLEVIRSITGLYQIHGIRTQVLSASIRSVHRAVRSWYNGASIVTMPPKVFEDMYEHILTRDGLAIFDKDWAEFSQGEELLPNTQHPDPV